MGYAPVLALRALFERTGTAPDDIDVVELNEAFASQAVAVIRDAGLDPARTNPYGGAIALGIPSERPVPSWPCASPSTWREPTANWGS